MGPLVAGKMSGGASMLAFSVFLGAKNKTKCAVVIKNQLVTNHY
jgi:hypothetical protein